MSTLANNLRSLSLLEGRGMSSIIGAVSDVLTQELADRLYKEVRVNDVSVKWGRDGVSLVFDYGNAAEAEDGNRLHFDGKGAVQGGTVVVNLKLSDLDLEMR